jgi:hypothetical protein
MFSIAFSLTDRLCEHERKKKRKGAEILFAEHETKNREKIERVLD